MAYRDMDGDSMDWKPYLPSPKMAYVLYAIVIAVGLVLIADWLDIADVRPAVSALFVGIAGFAAGWLKTDDG